jgi:hypothetical protein
MIKSKISLITALMGMSAAVVTHATVFYSDNFDGYSDGPLADTANWSRAPSSANPSNYPVISGGAVSFDWNNVSNDTVFAANHTVDSADIVESGMLYASFTFNASRAPSSAVGDVEYPGFFGFRNSDGSATRGRIGINPGSTSGTLSLGVSSGTQQQSGYSFSSIDLSTNTTYTVVLGYNVDTTGAQLWINPANSAATPVVTVAGTNSQRGIRRVALNLRNKVQTNVDLGAFTLDNLVVATTLAEVGVAAVPEPATVSLISGSFLLGLVAFRRRLRR